MLITCSLMSLIFTHKINNGDEFYCRKSMQADNDLPCTPELLVEVPNPDPDDSTAEALVTTFSAH